MVDFEITDPEESSPLSDVMVISDIPARYPPIKLDLKVCTYLDLDLVKNADILIGMDNAHLLKPIQVRSNQRQKDPYAIKTVLGWFLCGSAVSSMNSDIVTSQCVAIDSQITQGMG